MAEAAKPAKGGGMGWLLLIVVAVLAAGAGAALPRVLVQRPQPSPKAHVDKESSKPAVIPFGDIVVNLGEERLTRYLRAKILLVTAESHEKELNEVLGKQKAFLKSWLIGHLSDQSLQEVGRAAGVNRIRREIRDQFNAMMFPDGSEKIHDVLFDEFVVQ